MSAAAPPRDPLADAGLASRLRSLLAASGRAGGAVESRARATEAASVPAPARPQPEADDTCSGTADSECRAPVTGIDATAHTRRSPNEAVDAIGAINATPDAGAHVDLAAAVQALAARSRQQAVAARRDLPGETVADGVRLMRTSLPLPPGVSACLDDPLLGSVFGAAAPAGLLAIDTETTGLAGGTGTIPFLVGHARIADDRIVVSQWLLVRPGAEYALLAAAADEARSAGALVSFNGKTFDLPLLAARCRLRGVADAWTGRAHWDLLHPLRAAYATRWPDCRLRSAEQRLLGLERADDVPGALAQQAWLAFLRHGAQDLLRGLIAHNRQDLVSLFALLPALRAVYADPLRHGADAVAVARRLSARGAAAPAESVLVDALSDPDARRMLADTRRREGRHAEAWDLLAPLLGRPHAPADLLLAAARLAEHGLRDPARALVCARRLLVLTPTDAGHRARIARLERKLAAAKPMAAASPTFGTAALPFAAC
jgi:hypothetical protein